MSQLERRYHVVTVSGWLTPEAARRARAAVPHMTAEVYDLGSGQRAAAYRTEDLRGPIADRRRRVLHRARAEARRLNAAWRAEQALLLTAEVPAA